MLPIRDSLGVFLGNTPVRVGELFSALFCIPIVKTRKFVISSKEGIMLLSLLINLLITVMGMSLNFDNINVNFAFKYMLRNVLNILLVWGFIVSGYTYTKDDVARLVKFTVCLQAFSFVVLYLFKHYWFMGSLLDLSYYRDAGVYISSFWVPRFVGTCSEPGYLAPILTFPLFFYLNRVLINNKMNEFKYLITCIIMVIFTFSAAVYVFTGIIAVYFVLSNIKHKRVIVSVLVALLFAFMFLFVIFSNPDIEDYVVNKTFGKVLAFVTLSEGYMASSSDRIQQLISCAEYVANSNGLQLLFGHGTGAYSLYASNLGGMLSSAEEAYNIYLSTVADRGILGLSCILVIVYTLAKMVTKNDLYSETIFVGIVSQLLHWMIVGNFWLYYFWYEVVILLGYYKGEKHINIK